MKKYTSVISALVLLLGLVFINLAAAGFHHRFDLTQDKRFTLSEATREITHQIQSPLLVEVFLQGSFPAEFKKLQTETRQLLKEFSDYNRNIRFEFIDPLEAPEYEEKLEENELIPVQVSVTEGGKQSLELVYPWALAHYENKTVKIPLLKNQLGSTSEERVNNSIQNLQYALADGFKKLAMERSRKIAVLKGNGELDDRYLADFVSTLRDYYFIAPFTLDSVASNPEGTLRALRDFDLILVAKPTEAFSEAEKYVLDQFIMNGGNSLWLIDSIFLQEDPGSGNVFAVGMDLNLSDFFFKYGIRVNPGIVKDVYSAPIVLASGEDREAQFDRYPWFFSPLSSSANNHPVVTNIEAVRFEYASPMDTLANPIQKTILLSSSPITKIVGVPYEIDFNLEIPENLQIINEGPDPQEYRAGEVPLAVLLEGSFTSVYNNRVKPFQLRDLKNIDSGKKTGMIVISDGDVIRNQLQGGRPLELGFDRMTGAFYGNKEFLLNSVNYLLDDSGLINIRTKKAAVPFLDIPKVVSQRTRWQLINLLLPIGFLTVFGAGFFLYRKKKYRS